MVRGSDLLLMPLQQSPLLNRSTSATDEWRRGTRPTIVAVAAGAVAVVVAVDATVAVEDAGASSTSATDVKRKSTTLTLMPVVAGDVAVVAAVAVNVIVSGTRVDNVSIVANILLASAAID